MASPTPVVAYVALGANLGDRRGTIERAVDRLANTPGVKLQRISTLVETQAVGGPDDSPPFLNGAIEIATTLSPRELLALLLQIEADLGRTRRDKWEPRLIDLDLLLYGHHMISQEDLMVPHPLMHERRFVLEPLAEIAPSAVHPALQMSIRGLLEDLDRRPAER